MRLVCPLVKLTVREELAMGSATRSSCNGVVLLRKMRIEHTLRKQRGVARHASPGEVNAIGRPEGEGILL